MGDSPKNCSLSIFINNTNTDNPYKVQFSCKDSKNYHHISYPFYKISGIAEGINKLLNKRVPELDTMGNTMGMEIQKIPITTSELNEIKTFLGKDVKTVMTGGSRRARRRPSRKYKKSAKRVFRKKSRSTRRR